MYYSTMSGENSRLACSTYKSPDHQVRHIGSRVTSERALKQPVDFVSST
jgi:hypothetical protein